MMRKLKKLAIYAVTLAALALVALAVALVNWPGYDLTWLILQIPAVLVGGGWLVAFVAAN